MVKPNAKQSRLIKFEDGVLHLAIAAPPRDGKANRELINFLSSALGVTKSDLTIEKGLASRRKIVSFRHHTRERLITIIARLLGPAGE